MDAEVDIELNKMPLIGDDAPSFSADTTMGKISFPDDFKGKWVVLFSHPPILHRFAHPKWRPLLRWRMTLQS